VGISVDSSDARRLAAVFDEAADVASDEVHKVVKRGANNIKKDAQRRISGHPHLPHYPRSINYDTAQTRNGATAEIGPDKSKRQGPLGNIIEYGTVKNAPIPHLGPALQAEEPRFVKALENLAADVIERGRGR
jgi:hypothetical protein